ncbi:acetyltransferase [Methylobacterium sp. J-088]|uniref:acetyltransferase n=1 Tax=Methylobacterium sp. J-088 TaxID=2836664 RepID=UPI001FB91D3D|nr:acetyltransferase [Methylobacterium sp. J-088]MCJ2064318.1 acetyltransferase [Methylobacterium sp. J-088]
MKRLIIFGNGEIANMAYEYFKHDSDYTIVAFSIGEEYIKEKEFLGLPVIPLADIRDAYPPEAHDAFVAIGDSRLNRVRTSLYAQVKELGYTLTSYISTRAFVWHNCEIGENCFILEDNVIQPFVKIGNNVTLWSGNHIGHRSVIEDNVFISSHVVISGFCTVGSYSFLGVNAAVGHGVAIASDNFISMAASVAQSTEPDKIYQGNPAEPRKISATRFCRAR